MKLRNRALLVAAVTATLVLGGTTAAVATIEYPPEGGVWDYDAAGPTLYSNYYHPAANHRSSVVTCNGALTRSAIRGAGLWSYASRGDGCLFAVDYAYYYKF